MFTFVHQPNTTLLLASISRPLTQKHSFLGPDYDDVSCNSVYVRCNQTSNGEQTHPCRLCWWTWRRRCTAPLRGPPPTMGSLHTPCEHTDHQLSDCYYRRRSRTWRKRWDNLRRNKCWLGMQDDWERRSHRGELSPTLRITVTLRYTTLRYCLFTLHNYCRLTAIQASI